MSTAIAESNTRHANGFENAGRSSRAPYPRAPNQTMLAAAAPTPNHARAESKVEAMDPSRTTVSRETCGLSQVSARAVAMATPTFDCASEWSAVMGEGRNALRADIKL